MKWLFKPGILLPFVGRRQLPVNRDGSLVDRGARDLLNETSPFYVEILSLEWLGGGLSLTPQALIMERATGRPAMPPGMPGPKTDAQIAVRLMALDEGENVEGWIAKWDPLFEGWGSEEHAGDCTGIPHTCNRCVHEEYMARAAEARRVFDLP